jgi:hypothetical protein
VDTNEVGITIIIITIKHIRVFLEEHTDMWKSWNWSECAIAHSNQFHLFHDNGRWQKRFDKYQML